MARPESISTGDKTPMNMPANPKTILTMKEAQEATSLSRATINRYRQIGGFPKAIQLTDNRIAFKANEIEEWVSSRPREKGPEVNDNKRRVRCPQTPSELEEARLQEYAQMKANRQGDVA